MPSRLPPFQKEQEAGIMADEKNPKVEYTKSTAQLDAERRAEAAERGDLADNVVEHFVSVQPTYGVEEDGGYLGTDPIYRNAADERQEPGQTDEDWQRLTVTADLSDAGERNLPFVPGHLGTGAPKLESHGPVTSTSTVQPVNEPRQSAAPQVATPGTK